MSERAGQWTITVDNIDADSESTPTNSNATGMVGPRSATMTAQQIVSHPDSKRFRMKDDDGNVVYIGRCYLPDGLTEAAFGRLTISVNQNAGVPALSTRHQQTAGKRLSRYRRTRKVT